MGRVTLELAQPAALGTGVRKAGVQQSQQHIPGTVLRGALAARWIARYGPPTVSNPHRDEFERIFEGDVVFGPLLPPQALPMPRSCWVHKYDAGRGCPLWLDEATGTPAPAGQHCAHCDGPLQRASGDIETVRDGQLRSPIDTVEDTHVKIGADGRATDGDLFTRRRLARGQRFLGHLSGPSHDVELAVSFGSVLWLGGRRSTSGRARLTHEPGSSPAPVQRLESGVLVLRLASPGIFVDGMGRPQSAPDERELSEVFGTRARVERRWTRWTTVSGWHAASGLPKPTEVAAAPGSTYLVRCDAEPDPAAQAALATRGVGLRRVEGYGALVAGPDAVLPTREG